MPELTYNVQKGNHQRDDGWNVDEAGNLHAMA
jgi:hypothetical protein